MKKVKSIVLAGNGINCEVEMAHACRLAGSEEVDIVYLYDLLSGEVRLDDYHFLCFPGGFLDGDDLGSAKAMAHRMKHAPIAGSGEKLEDAIRRFIQAGQTHYRGLQRLPAFGKGRLASGPGWELRPPGSHFDLQ